MAGDDVAHVTVPCAWLADGQRRHEAVVRHLDHVLALLVHLANGEGLVEVAMVAVLWRVTGRQGVRSDQQRL